MTFLFLFQNKEEALLGHLSLKKKHFPEREPQCTEGHQTSFLDKSGRTGAPASRI